MRTNLTKKDITNSIYMQIGFSKKISEMLIDDILQIILQNIIKQKKVKISKFGTFSLRKKNNVLAEILKQMKLRLFLNVMWFCLKHLKISETILIKMDNLKENSKYKTIGEVAEILNLVNKKNGTLSTHTIRFWEKQFKQIKPKIFSETEDIMMKIQYLY